MRGTISVVYYPACILHILASKITTIPQMTPHRYWKSAIIIVSHETSAFKRRAGYHSSDPNFHANLVGKYGAMQLKASMKKKKKSQQSKEAPGGCGWKAPRKHELDVDSQPPHMHEHVADYSKLYTQSRSLHET